MFCPNQRRPLRVLRNGMQLLAESAGPDADADADLTELCVERQGLLSRCQTGKDPCLEYRLGRADGEAGWSWSKLVLLCTSIYLLLSRQYVKVSTR